MLPRLTLIVAFRETGWRRPLRDPVTLEIWSAGALVATLPASYLEELVRWQLAGATLQAQVTRYTQPLAPEAPPSPRRLLAPPRPRLRGRNGRGLRGVPPAR